ASATAAESQSLRRTAEARVRLSSPTGAATHRSVRRAARSCESARPGSESGHLCAMRGFMTPPPGSRLAFRARHGHHFPRSHVLCADCHETAHEGNEAACEPIREECVALCQTLDPTHHIDGGHD